MPDIDPPVIVTLEEVRAPLRVAPEMAPPVILTLLESWVEIDPSPNVLLAAAALAAPVRVRIKVLKSANAAVPDPVK